MVKNLEITKDYPVNKVDMSKEEIINIIKEHEIELRNKYHVEILCLCGSFTKEIITEYSDIDFLVRFNNDKSDNKDKLAKYLSKILHHSKVDMVDFDNEINKEFNDEANNIMVIIK